MLGMLLGHAGDVENDAGDVDARENAVKRHFAWTKNEKNTKKANKSGKEKQKNPHPL